VPRRTGYASSRGNMKPEGWDTEFDDAVPLPGGGSLHTLRAAGDHIAKLSKRDQLRPEWQRAAADLMKAATVDRAWRWLARSTVYVAIHGAGDAVARPLPRASDEERWREKRRAVKIRKRQWKHSKH
jgi:hypothetical protein